MKILKKILCVLLSSMFLLFAGACMPETYKDTTSNEFIDFEVLAYSTACVGEDSSVKAKYTITVKKEFWLFSSQWKEVENMIYLIALNDKYDEEYYKQLSNINLLLNNSLHSSADRYDFGESIRLIHCEKGSEYGKTTFMRRSYGKTVVADKGKYRLYLLVGGLYLKNPYASGEFNTEIQAQNYLIPTDIVLDMQ